MFFDFPKFSDIHNSNNSENILCRATSCVTSATSWCNQCDQWCNQRDQWDRSFKNHYSIRLWMPPDLRNNLDWCLETFQSILACTTLVLSTFDNGDQLCNQLRNQCATSWLVTNWSRISAADFGTKIKSSFKKKLKPCRILIVDMPRYQVFHLTRSDLGDICWKKKFFFSKSMTPMYLLFK